MRALLALASLAVALASAAGCHLIVRTDDIVGADASVAAPDARFDGAIVGMLATSSGRVAPPRLEGGHVALRFGCDKDAGCAMDELRVTSASNADLLFHKTEESQTNEQLAGISYFDWDYTWRAQGDRAAVAVEGGPAVGQLILSWTSGKMNGTSFYTMHPDGRLHRSEIVTVTVGRPGWLLAYTALDANRLPQAGAATFSPDGGFGAFTPVTDELQVREQPGYGCASNPETKEAVAWAQRGHPAIPLAGLRVKPVDSSLLLASDWVQEQDVAADTTWLGSFLTFVSDRGCEAAPEHVAAFLDPPKLSVTKGSLHFDDSLDVDEDGYAEGGGYYVLTAEGDSTVEVTLPAGSRPLPSCTLRFMNSPQTVPTVEIGDAASGSFETLLHERDYLAARSSREGFWIYLARRWEPGQQLKITW